MIKGLMKSKKRTMNCCQNVKKKVYLIPFLRIIKNKNKNKDLK